MKTAPPPTAAISTDAPAVGVGFRLGCAALEAPEATLETLLRTESVSELCTDESEDNNELSDDATSDDREETTDGSNELLIRGGSEKESQLEAWRLTSL